MKGLEDMTGGVVNFDSSKIFEAEDQSKSELLIPDLENISGREYFEFLAKLVDHKDRHKIPQETVDRIMETGLQVLEKAHNSFHLACRIHDALQLHGDFRTNDPSQPESITDKSYRALVKLYNKYPAAGHEMENLFGQNHTVQPKVLMAVIADACGNPDTDKYLLQEMVFSLNYILSFGGDAYDEALLSQLDFKNPDNLYKTGRFLELIQRLINVSSENEFSEDLIYKISDILKEAVGDEEVSYFLSIRARKILSDIGEEGYSWSRSSSDKKYEKIDDSLLVTPRSNESEEQIQRDKNDLTDFHYLMSSSIRDYVEGEFKIDIDSLSDQEKFYFLKLIKLKSRDEVERVKTFTAKFGSSGFKSFLSIDYGMEMGDKILKIGETLKQEDAEQIFDKYSELVSQIDKVEDVLNDAYGKDAHGDEVVRIKEAILRKGKELLEKFSSLLDAGQELSSDEIIAQLQRIEVEATTFFLTFKTLKETKQLPAFEEIKGISFQERGGPEISEAERSQMEAIYRENYANNTALAKDLLVKLGERLGMPETRFYLLKYQDEVKAFIGFTPTDGRDSLTFHSFNVEPSLRGISIGNTMMEKAIDLEAAAHVLEAECMAYEVIGSKYIEDGCVATSIFIYEGAPVLNIVRDEKKNGEYWGKQMIGKEDELVEMATRGGLPEGAVVQSQSEQKDIEMESMFPNYVLTRYFKSKKDGRWYVVFEKNN